MVLSVAESAYLIYMFHLFKTSVDFNVLAQGRIGRHEFFRHLSGSTYGLRICPFGRVVVLVYIAGLLGRNVVPIPESYMRAALATSAFLAMMNTNAVVYLLPVWAVELMRGL